MRHRIAGKKLGRTTTHRLAMERNMIVSVIRHERVVTTLTRAKAMRRNVDRMITLGKTRNLARFRRALSALQDRDAVRKLFDILGPRYAARRGGYTRVVRLPGYRIGDGGTRAILELVDNDVLERQKARAAEVENEVESEAGAPAS
ncbi:MAG: 50S ribosomal protein L17 [Planctomycetota bacterium]